VTDVFVVMARDDRGYRWLDSLWLKEESAKQRRLSLERGMASCGLPVNDAKWRAFIAVFPLEDGKIVEGKEKTPTSGKKQ